MRRDPAVYVGGWYIDCNALGRVVLYPGLRLVHNGQDVPLPSGQNVFFVRLSNDGQRFAGQGAGGVVDLRAMERVNGQWRDAGYGPGHSPAIYDKDDVLRLWSPDIGVQGYRFVADDGRLVTGDESDNPYTAYAQQQGITNLWGWTRHGNIAVGQKGEGPGRDPLVAVNVTTGARYRLQDGACKFIRFYRYGDELIISWWQEDAGYTAKELRLNVADLVDYPADADVPPPPPPPPDIPPEPRSEPQRSGEITDTLDYVLGAPSLWPRGGDHAMDLWVYADRQALQYQKFAVGAFETWRWNADYIYHHQDGSHREYYFTDGRWMRRRWQIGEAHAITCETNQIQYFGDNCALSTRGSFPYKTYLEGYYPRYWCGSDLGERPVIVFVYDNTRGITNDPGLHLERFFFAKGAGWFRWEYIRADTGELESNTEFYRVTGPRVAFAQRCRPLPPIVSNPDPGPPVDEIPSLEPLVVDVWHRYDGQDHGDPVIRGKMLNTIAWEGNGFNGAGPWFLSAKPAGSSAPQPGTGTPIAHDIVQYGQTEPDGHFNGFDVFTDTGPIWIEAGQHNQPSRVAVNAVNPAGAGGGGDEDDMTIDEHVQAMIDAATAPLIARITALEQGGGTAPTPTNAVLYGDKVGLRSQRNGCFVCNDADRNEGHKLHADDRTSVGSWETFTLQKAT